MEGFSFKKRYEVFKVHILKKLRHTLFEQAQK